MGKFIAVGRSACPYWLAAFAFFTSATLGACLSDPDDGRVRVGCTPRGIAMAGKLADKNNYMVGINFDGSVVAGNCGGAVSDAYRWTARSGAESIASTVGFYASALSRDGTTIRGWGTPPTTAALGPPEPVPIFHWTEQSGIVPIEPLVGDKYAVSFGMSADGSVVVGISTNDSSLETNAIAHPFRWTEASGTVEVGPLASGTGGAAIFVSADGRVIVGHSSSFPTSTSGPPDGSFVWTSDAGLVPLPGFRAGGVNDDGSVIVGDTDAKPMRWTKDLGTSPLTLLPGDSFGYAFGVAADGSAAIGWSGYHLARWTADGNVTEIGGGHSFSQQWTNLCMSADGGVVVATDYYSEFNYTAGEPHIATRVMWDTARGLQKQPFPIDCITGDGKWGYGQGPSSPRNLDAFLIPL